VHLVGFIIKKFVTMHGHMNVKKGPVITYHQVSQFNLYIPPKRCASVILT